MIQCNHQRKGVETMKKYEVKFNEALKMWQVWECRVNMNGAILSAQLAKNFKAEKSARNWVEKHS